ncbi:hypothetical protein ACYPKM_02000 [Pseudomonas aeruginosa]
MKPRNVILSAEVRAEIKASQGILSLSEAARRFGVSRRTVGRIYHGGELSLAKDNSASEMSALRQEIANLNEMVSSLTKALESQHHQRLRQELNPALHGEQFQSSPYRYSSPYRDQVVMLVSVYGRDVPVPQGWREEAEERWFVASNPVSPGCETYPYPQPKSQRGNEEQPAKVLVYRDPPVGISCNCSQCKQWRLGLAYEAALLRNYHYALAEYAVFRVVR